MVLFRKRPVYLPGMKAKHVVLISIDGLNAKDFYLMKELSYFSEMIRRGSVAREMVGVYPSLTYPSHVSIITGVYPNKHGITDNKPFAATCQETPWFFYAKDIAAPTLYDVAIKKGLSTGSFFWPVTAGANIHYNCPPIWPTSQGESQIALSLRNGSPGCLLELERRFNWLRHGRQYPQLDNFTAVSAAYLLKKYQPNLLLVAFSELDHERHEYGRNSKQAEYSLVRTNERVGLIIEAAKDAEIYNDTAFVIVGDHGFLDYNKCTALNRIFLDNGYLTADDQGEVLDYLAFAQAAGGSAQIYLQNKTDQKIFHDISLLLRSLKDSGESGIAEIYTAQQTMSKGLSGDFSFVVEADQGYCFTSSINSPPVTTVQRGSKAATHGYDPEKSDYQSLAIFSGSGIKMGAELPSINCVDIAPTLSQLLDLNLQNCDGKILTQMLTGN